MTVGKAGSGTAWSSPPKKRGLAVELTPRRHGPRCQDTKHIEVHALVPSQRERGVVRRNKERGGEGMREGGVFSVCDSLYI